jgi:hypothetical protein
MEAHLAGRRHSGRPATEGGDGAPLTKPQVCAI